MNIEKLKNKIKSYATENNLTVQEAWDKYFFDSLLIKLSRSNYKDNFVLKGGFLLAHYWVLLFNHLYTSSMIF